MYSKFARQIFDADSQEPGWFLCLRKIGRCFLMNSAYGAKKVDKAFKKAFGCDHTINSYNPGGLRRKRVLVTVNEIGNPTPMAFHNYNDSEGVPASSGECAWIPRS